jgi:hypothetical protein
MSTTCLQGRVQNKQSHEQVRTALPGMETYAVPVFCHAALSRPDNRSDCGLDVAHVQAAGVHSVFDRPPLLTRYIKACGDATNTE